MKPIDKSGSQLGFFRSNPQVFPPDARQCNSIVGNPQDNAVNELESKKLRENPYAICLSKNTKNFVRQGKQGRHNIQLPPLNNSSSLPKHTLDSKLTDPKVFSPGSARKAKPTSAANKSNNHAVAASSDSIINGSGYKVKLVKELSFDVGGKPHFRQEPQEMVQQKLYECEIQDFLEKPLGLHDFLCRNRNDTSKIEKLINTLCEDIRLGHEDVKVSDGKVYIHDAVHQSLVEVGCLINPYSGGIDPNNFEVLKACTQLVEGLANNGKSRLAKLIAETIFEGEDIQLRENEDELLNDIWDGYSNANAKAPDKFIKSAVKDGKSTHIETYDKLLKHASEKRRDDVAKIKIEKMKELIKDDGELGKNLNQLRKIFKVAGSHLAPGPLGDKNVAGNAVKSCADEIKKITREYGFDQEKVRDKLLSEVIDTQKDGFWIFGNEKSYKNFATKYASPDVGKASIQEFEELKNFLKNPTN